MVGEDAPEIMQGMAIAMKCGASKRQFDATVGIHPTVAEEFVTMRTKRQWPVQAQQQNETRFNDYRNTLMHTSLLVTCLYHKNLFSPWHLHFTETHFWPILTPSLRFANTLACCGPFNIKLVIRKGFHQLLWRLRCLNWPPTQHMVPTGLSVGLSRIIHLLSSTTWEKIDTLCFEN